MVRSTFGLLVSADTGKTWDWVCEEAPLGLAGAAGIENPGVALTASGSIIISASEGLKVSPDTGCTWNVGEPQYFVDVAVRPDNPHAAIALSSAYDGEGGVQSFNNQLYSTTDDGAHWTAYGVPFGSSYAGDTVEVSASDPHRVYVTGELTSTTGAALFVSTTDGTAWVQHAIPLLAANEEAAFIGAVDPTNADRVYLRTGDHFAMQASRLLVTDDAGMTFTSKFTGNAPMQGFALAPDGSKIYIGFSAPVVDGGAPQGLQVASTTDFAFTQHSSVLVQCLALSGSTLYACAPEVNGFIVGASMDDGMTFTTLLHLCSVRGPLACPADSSAGMICPMVWAGGTAEVPVGLQMQLGVPCQAPPDAGPDTGPPVSNDAGPRTVPRSSGGCATSGGGATVAWYGLGGLASLWIARVWRRRGGARARRR